MSDVKKSNGNTSVIDKLRQYASENEGREEIVLKKTKVKVTMPKVITHGMMTTAQAKARGQMGKSVDYVIADICDFDGSKLTHDQVATLLPSSDVQQIQAIIFGDMIGDSMDKLFGGDQANEA